MKVPEEVVGGVLVLKSGVGSVATESCDGVRRCK